MALDICSYFIDLIDEIVRLFQKIDAKLTSLVNIWNDAVSLADKELQAVVDCGFSETKAIVINLKPLLTFIQPASDVLGDMFLQFIPNQQLRDAIEMYRDAATWNAQAMEALGTGLPLPDLPGFTSPPPKVQHEKVAAIIPPMAPFFENLNRSRNAMVMLYNTLAPWVGRDPDKSPRTMPEFVNF